MTEPYTYIRRDYSLEEEELVRQLTNPNGRGNSAYDPREMLPQDNLREAEITIMDTTGMACEFRWASGRKDVWIVANLPRECVTAEIVARRAAYIEQLKERNHAQKAAA